MFKRAFTFRSIAAVIFLLGSLSVTGAGAQTGSVSQFTNTQIRVLDSAAFLDMPKRDFKVGENLKFVHPIRAGARNEAVVLRIFPTSKNQPIPTELAFHNPCYVYLSVLMDVFVEGNGTIYINPPTKEWLTAIPGQGLATSYFTLVFERASAQQEFGLQFFRLNGGDRKEYFSERGFMISVAPGSATATEKELREQAAAANESWVRNRQIAQTVNDSKHECRWLKLVKGSVPGGPMVLAQADPDCEPFVP